MTQPGLKLSDEVVELAEAMYRASLSDPHSDAADRHWPRVRGYWIAKAKRVRQMQGEFCG